MDANDQEENIVVCGCEFGKGMRAMRCHANLSDEDLMAEYCATRSEAAFSELYLRFGDVARCYIVKNVKPHEADDLTQEVFISLWKYAHLYRTGCSVKTFVIKIAANRCRMHYRKLHQKKRDVERVVPIDNAEGVHRQIERPTGNLDPRADRVREAIAALPDLDRRIIECLYLKEMTYNDTAMQLGLPIGTLNSRSSRLIRRLRESLNHNDAIEAA